MDPKSVGKKIKLARVELDMNQTELAEKIGVKQKNVSMYENGTSTPSLETMSKISKVLKKSMDHFVQ
ncbi:MAG: helix-turn-helix transcriptional regulator [Candidatus Omnitrophica bacterium]|nr:helix-turn-helix transcriptional regulator [Candidatus Omnitrophota bacterium]